MFSTTHLPPMAKLDEFLKDSSREYMIMDAIRSKILDDAAKGIYPDDSDIYRIVAGALYDNITNSTDASQYNSDLKLLRDYVRKRTAADCEEYIWHDGFNLEESLLIIGLNMLLTDVRNETREAVQLLIDLFKRYFRSLYRQAKKLNVFSLRQAEGFMETDDIINDITDLSIAYITCRINKIPIDDTGWLVVNLISKGYPLIRSDEEDFWEGFDNEDVRCLTEFILELKENRGNIREEIAVQETVAESLPKESGTKDFTPKEATNEEILELKKRIQELQYKADRQRELYEAEREKSLRLIRERDVAVKRAAMKAETEKSSEYADENTQGPSSEEMIRTIKDRKITIIGGHENWVYKLRNMFPKWTYLSPKEQGTVPVSIVSGTEIIYFFSNHICHPQYNRFLDAARLQKIPVKYISRVNVNDNIRQIYGDVSCM